MPRRNLVIAAAVGALAVGVFVNCGKKEEPVVNDPATNPPAMPPAPGGNSGTGASTGAAANPAVPSGPPGTIEGVVAFTGKAPDMKEIPKPSDPVCSAAKPKDNSVLVSNGGLKDVLVRIEVGGAKAGDVPTTAPQLKQDGCMYVPRVLGVVAGQDIEVVNADKTMHNVHTYKGQETVLNAGQPAGSAPIKKPASDEAAIIKVKCDVHPWMTAFVIATDHPFFAVTDENGKFKIDKVPPGDYTVEAWHSEYGLKTMKVHVDSNKSVDPKFSYDGTEKKPE
jgi:plastocyanin